MRKNSKILYSRANGVRYSNQWQQLEEQVIFLLLLLLLLHHVRLGHLTCSIVVYNSQTRPMDPLGQCSKSNIYQDYVHKVPVILHGYFQHEFHKLYSPPTSVT